jgi:hypothetical protein
MPLKFFESSRRGIDLLTVTVDEGRQTANVFMRAAKIDRFKQATEAYAASQPGIGLGRAMRSFSIASSGFGRRRCVTCGPIPEICRR